MSYIGFPRGLSRISRPGQNLTAWRGPRPGAQGLAPERIPLCLRLSAHFISLTILAVIP
jgi:hypothetical protein